jgi:hypothetical protein
MSRCKHDFLQGTCGFKGCENQGKLPAEEMKVVREIKTAEGTVIHVVFVLDPKTNTYVTEGDGSGEPYTEEQILDLADIDPGQANSKERKCAKDFCRTLAAAWGRTEEGIRHKYERIHEEAYMRTPHERGYRN